MPQRFVSNIINSSSKFLITIFFVLIANNFGQRVETGFDCTGRSPGFYADDSPLSGCSIYHRCNFRGRKTTFRCPTGTLFRQQFLVCAHEHEVNCELSSMYYSVNSQTETVPLKLATKSLVTEVMSTEKSSENTVGRVEKSKTLKLQEPLIVLNRTRAQLVQEPKRNVIRIDRTRAPLLEVATSSQLVREPVRNVVRIVNTRRPLFEVATSTQKSLISGIRFPEKVNYLESNLTVNPLCPLCEPFFLRDGSCSPCVIIR